jgi:hypothetical protein
MKDFFKDLKKKFTEKWPEIRSWLYRWIRGSFATAVAMTVYSTCGQLIQDFDILTCAVSIRDKWTEPRIAMIAISTVFLSGFLLALGKAIRDEFGTDKRGEPNTFNKVSPL